MMIGVLLCSNSERVSSWAAVRGSEEILVTGMSKGDLVEIELKGNGHDGAVFMAMNENSKFGIPEGATFIKATHRKVGVSPNVCVDME